MVKIYIASTARGPRKGKCRAGYLLLADGKAYGISVSDMEEANRYGSLVRMLSAAAGRLNSKAEAVAIISEDDQIVTEVYRIRKREQDGWKRTDGKPIAEANAWKWLNKAIREKNYEARKPEAGDHYMDLLKREVAAGEKGWRIEHV